jgi:hypothetical protein
MPDSKTGPALPTEAASKDLPTDTGLLRPEVTEDEKIRDVTAQHLYDLRELTGFVSGTDLHALFRDVCNGEPSPSGETTIELSSLEKSEVGKQALELLNQPLWMQIPPMSDYRLPVDFDYDGVEVLVAQHLYDLRELTGFASGTDLQELFRSVCNGEPSPSGRIEIDPSALETTSVGQSAMQELNKPTWQTLQSIMDYTRE